KMLVIVRRIVSQVIQVLQCNLFKIRFSKMLSYLIELKLVKGDGDTGEGRSKYRKFLCWKAVLYTYLVFVPMRAIVLVIRQKHGGSLLDHVWIDPLMSDLMLQFHFLNQYSAPAAGLLGLFSLFFDY